MDEQEEQGKNRADSGSERLAASRVEEIVADWHERKRKPVELLRVICRMVAKNDGHHHQGFTALDLLQELKNADFRGWDYSDSDEIPKKIARPWRDLWDIWDKRKTGVYQRLANEGILFRPRLEKYVGGGSGNPSRYLLKFDEIAEDDSQYLTGNVPEGGVRYFTDLIESPGFLTRVLARGIELSGWRVTAYLSSTTTLLILFLLASLLLWLEILTAPSANSLIRALSSFAFLLTAGWILFRPLRDLIRDRITLAPAWLQPWDGHDDRLLERLWDNKRAANRLVMTQYSALCPLCDDNSKVRVCSGRREFAGRVVGRCSRAPNEHVYTFDHALRIGRPLR